MKIRQGMTSGECVENKWFNMKYIGKYLSVEILLTHECTLISQGFLKDLLDLFFQRNLERNQNIICKSLALAYRRRNKDGIGNII